MLGTGLSLQPGAQVESLCREQQVTSVQGQQED
jgi:hypothetical protein